MTQHSHNNNTLKKAYIQAAHIVSVHGDKYLPIFERLEKEYQDSLKKKSTLTRALALSNELDID